MTLTAQESCASRNRFRAGKPRALARVKRITPAWVTTRAHCPRFAATISRTPAAMRFLNWLSGSPPGIVWHGNRSIHKSGQPGKAPGDLIPRKSLPLAEVHLPQFRPYHHFEPQAACDGLGGLVCPSQVARIHGPERILGALIAQETQLAPSRTRQGNIKLTLKASIALRRRMPDQKQPAGAGRKSLATPKFSCPSFHNGSVLPKEAAPAIPRSPIPDGARIPTHTRHKGKPPG